MHASRRSAFDPTYLLLLVAHVGLKISVARNWKLDCPPSEITDKIFLSVGLRSLGAWHWKLEEDGNIIQVQGH